MAAVYYSIACDDHRVHERQWARSVESLRRHNDRMDVVLCLYGAPSVETLAVARAANVHVEQLGEYGAAFGDIPKHWRAAFRVYPVLHKLLSLRHLAGAYGDRLLYVDCDTYWFGDVSVLLESHVGAQWYAREEPASSRSHYGYDARHVDEHALGAIARDEGLVPIPPYNTGVFLADAGLVATIAGLVDDFLWYAWRLLVGASLWRPEAITDHWLVAYVRENFLPGEGRLALPYPSSSGWILEQIATWLTLGRVPGLSHDLLRRHEVVQNGEYLNSRGHILAHYFTAGEPQFLDELARIKGGR